MSLQLKQQTQYLFSKIVHENVDKYSVFRRNKEKQRNFE